VKAKLLPRLSVTGLRVIFHSSCNNLEINIILNRSAANRYAVCKQTLFHVFWFKNVSWIYFGQIIFAAY